eukprot:gene24925-33420_t
MSYSPNNEVLASHNIPLLDNSLRPSNVEFSVSQSYLHSLIVFPLLILASTLLISCILYSLAKFCRRFIYKIESHVEEQDYRRILFTRVFVTLLLTSVFIDGFLFLGSVRVTTALHSMEHAIVQLIALLNGVLASTTDILRRFSAISQAGASSSTCAAFTSTYMLSDMTNLAAASESSETLANSMLSTLHTLERFFQHPLVAQKDLSVGLFFGFVLLTVILHILALLCRSEKLFLISICLNVIVVLALFVCGSLIMVPLKFLGDFCMDPHSNLLKLLSGSSGSNSVAEIVSYYTACTGTNPFEVYIGEMNTELSNAQSALSTFLSSGYVDVQCYDMVSSNCTAIAMDTQSLSQQTSCEFPNRIYSSVVLGDVCNEAIVGIYDMWPIIFLLAALLFVALCVSNFVYTKYGLLPCQRQSPEMEMDNEKIVRHPMIGMLQKEDDEERGRLRSAAMVRKLGEKGDLKKAQPLVQAYELVPSDTSRRAAWNGTC